jgi:hypothetical protein
MHTSGQTDPRRAGRAGAPFRQILLGACVVFIAGCAAPGATPPPSAPTADTSAAAVNTAPAAPPVAPAPPPPPPPPPILPFDEAVLSAATNLLEKAQLAGDVPGGRYDVVIDPLIDGMTGQQSVATKAMGARIVKLIRESYPAKYAVQPFNTSAVQKGPLLLVGTFTGVNAERKTEGQREAFRICLALADLKTGKLVSKGLAFAKPDGVDIAPLPAFRDAPAWSDDAATSGYIRTCQGTRAGDSINPMYVNRIVTSATIAEAADAYSEGKYADALKLYETARQEPGRRPVAHHTGLYLTNLKPAPHDRCRKAFGEIIDQRAGQQALGVKFLFKPGTAAPWVRPQGRRPQPYAMWLRRDRRARRASARTPASSSAATPAPPAPSRSTRSLSLLRAEVGGKSIAARRAAARQAQAHSTKGYGSKQTLVGNGRDDLSDALDRRVELNVLNC